MQLVAISAGKALAHVHETGILALNKEAQSPCEVHMYFNGLLLGGQRFIYMHTWSFRLALSGGSFSLYLN